MRKAEQKTAKTNPYFPQSHFVEPTYLKLRVLDVTLSDVPRIIYYPVYLDNML